MSDVERELIVENSAPVEARVETAGPSTRPARSGEQAGLGRDDSKVEDRSCVHSNGVGSNNDTAGDRPLSPAVGERADNPEGPGALETGNLKLDTVTGLCHHVMESGFYCQSPALRGRRFCYSHLRLRGERMRMARAIANRLPYHLRLPALDHVAGVRVAMAQVADALAAGLLEPHRAGRLIFAFAQVCCALRWEAQARMAATSSADPTLSPKPGEKGGAPAGKEMGDNQKRLVEEYPEFEAEFGLPAGIDLSQPPHVVFPPPEQIWATATGAVGAAPTVTYNDPPPSYHRWTKEAIELEKLDKQREYMSEKSFNEQSCKIHGRIEKQVKTEMRKEQEAEWQAEADRRNALEEKKAQIYRNMDDGQRQAYHLGVLAGVETAERTAQEEAVKKKPAAKAAVGS